jgi:hypothetical protein
MIRDFIVSPVKLWLFDCDGVSEVLLEKLLCQKNNCSAGEKQLEIA